MKRSNTFSTVAAVVALGFGLVPYANAVEEQRSVEASPDGTVSISNVSGKIDVSGWSRNQVDVSADLGAGVEELIVERDGNDVVVKVKTPRNRSRNIRSELTIRVPEMSSLDVGGVDADIEVRNVFGEQRLHSVSGDIATEVFESDIEAEVVSGDIEISGDGKAMFTQLTSVSGDIDMSGLAGDIEVSSVSGDLAVTNGRFQRGQANTVNGDMVFRAEIENGGRLDMETINGSIDLHFLGTIDARFDIETFNGAIRNCFGPKPQRTSRYTPGSELKFTEGNGSSRVTLRTLNGRMDICRD